MNQRRRCRTRVGGYRYAPGGLCPRIRTTIDRRRRMNGRGARGGRIGRVCYFIVHTLCVLRSRVRRRFESPSATPSMLWRISLRTLPLK